MRRFGLAGKFAVASALAMAGIGLLLARVEATQIRNRALANASDAAVMLSDVGLRSHLQPTDLTVGVTPGRLAALDAVFEAGLADGRIARVKIWSATGKVIYSDDHTLIGRTFPVSDDLREALDGETSSDISSLDEAENVGERRFGQLLEVYLPLRFDRSGPPAGAFEIYVPYVPIKQAIAADTRRLYLIILAGLCLLWGVLFRMVVTASRRLRRDAAELKRRADENEYLALHDQLTDLPNRVLFRDRVQQEIGRAERDADRVAVLIMDLDRFKEINDTLGHDRGDLALAQVAPRVRAVLRSSDTVARLGGDDFGILVGSLGEIDEALVVASKLHASLDEPIDLGEVPVDVEATIGIAVYPDHGADADELMRRAEVAMYVAKHDRVPVRVYSIERDLHSMDRLTLLPDLRRAIDADEIELHYQPKIDLVGGAVVGVEALARWHHEQRGWVPPDVFVPLAERTGTMRRLTSHVLDTAAAQARAWLAQGIELPIAVNLSVRDLLDPTLTSEVVDVLERYDLRPSLLGFELTESAIMDQPAQALEVLNALSAIGLELAIDDFGTGYSSLAYLQRLPVQQLKIDRSFVLELDRNEGDAAIVRSTIELGHSLGLTVVAEGVEDASSFGLLDGFGCDIAQGFHIARPMPAEELERWLSTSSRAVLARST